MKRYSIIENGEQLDVNPEQKNVLERKGIIYFCGLCGDHYHICPGYVFDDVEREISDF